MQAKALTASGAAISGAAELVGVVIHNDHTALSDVTIDDSTDGSGDVKWKGRCPADESLHPPMIQDGNGNGIKMQTGLYVTISNENSITVIVLFK